MPGGGWWTPTWPGSGASSATRPPSLATSEPSTVSATPSWRTGTAHDPSPPPLPSEPVMAMRPLDRLPTIRAKLGSVIVFAVAVTILIMYVAVGFALRQSDRDREFHQAVDQAQTVQALSFGPGGQPSRNLAGLLAQVPGPV